MMSMSAYIGSALYVGSVMHRRLAPIRHVLHYRAFWILMDLDEPALLASRLRLFSYNRFNVFSFYDTDHGDGQITPLRSYIKRELVRHGISDEIGKATLLCMPRIFGYTFNPLSIYFCYRIDGTLAALLYEVRNTFGQRHSYLIPVHEQTGVVCQHCAKAFYVSPFLDMDLTYDFRIALPAASVSAVIIASNQTRPIIVASMAGKRRELSDRGLLLVLLDYQLITLKVVCAIHWEALRIWLKGVRLRSRPPAPVDAVSFVSHQPLSGGSDVNQSHYYNSSSK